MATRDGVDENPTMADGHAGRNTYVANGWGMTATGNLMAGFAGVGGILFVLLVTNVGWSYFDNGRTMTEWLNDRTGLDATGAV